MRIALITLAVAALAFIGSIIWIFVERNGVDLIPTQNTSSVKISSETAAIEILRSQWKTEDRIKELEAKVDLLSGKNPTSAQVSLPTNTGTTNSINSGSTTQSGTTPIIIPISAKFLTKVISKMNLALDKNNGIYGLYTFDASTIYSTYTDIKSGIIIIATRTPYSAWLANWRAIDKSLFIVNESKTFPFASFYLNPPHDDSIIRIVMQVETQTLLISVPKSRFPEFKTMMTKK
jgi:hypothetical protein